ncbi:hypothetical protein Mapa_013735 [Marchantia paleacea]|nr:hypothetical protein Mapa_013735 [Marchantia paleacea]
MDSPRGDNTASSSTFQLNVSSLGAIKLKDAVKTKLSEFMGSYTDDVLAEYVVVLVGHGKRQSQAIADLEAFLGDQSKAFVSWLWEHLSANQSSYVDQPSLPAAKITLADNGKSSSFDREFGSSDEQASSQRGESGKILASVIETVSTSANEMPVRDGKDSEQAALMKGGNEPQVLTGSSRRAKKDTPGYHHEDDSLDADEEQIRDQTRASDVKRTRSPEPWSRRGRGRVEERQQHKRDSSPPNVKAPRRLLESAVRDAVAPGGVINSSSSSRRTETGYKRLRSVVSADVDTAEVLAEPNGRHQQMKPRLELAKKGSKVSPAVAVAMKAAAAAAEDVNNNFGKTSRGRLTASVWERLGNRNSEKSGLRDEDIQEPVRLDVDNTEALEDRWIDAKHGGSEETRLGKRPKWRKMSERLGRGPMDAEDGNTFPSDMAPAATGGYYKNKKIIENQWPASTVSSLGFFEDRSGREDDLEDAVNHEDGRLFRYGSSRGVSGHGLRSCQDAGNVQLRQGYNHQDKAVHVSQQKAMSGSSGIVNLSEKLSNTLSDVNIDKQQSEDVDTAPDLRQELLSKLSKSLSAIERTAPPSSGGVDTNDVTEMKKRMRQVQLEMTKLRAKQAEVSKEVQKVVSAPGSGLKVVRSQEEINAHSVCVSNIHFAATKEAIAAHFSSCGDIVRVTVLMDTATGKPKGSAYVEFAQKDGVEKAMNMNDSSLLSRTLKVMRKDAADALSPATAVRPAHGSPFVSVRAPPIGNFLRGPPPIMRRPPSLSRPFPGSAHLQWKRETSAPSPGTNGAPNFGQSTGSSVSTPGRVAPIRSPNSSVMGDRYGHGPIRMTRSLSYVRPAPYTPRDTPPAVQEQKVAN